MIHGDRTQSQRNGALSGFQEGRFQVLVATDIASRGLHCDDVAHVINYDIPKMAEDFIHRVGRTGRAGARGTASTFATRSERAEVAHIERTLTTRLIRRTVSDGALCEQRATAPVIVMPTPALARQRRSRTFSPKVKARRWYAV
jgi:ATP-dependent RNA helicase RhlE